MPVIPALWGVYIRRIVVQTGLGKNARLYSKIKAEPGASGSHRNLSYSGRQRSEDRGSKPVPVRYIIRLK
jgi:hypothetical protein